MSIVFSSGVAQSARGQSRASAMGSTGAPFDMCMVEDAEEILGGYKAAVFAMPIPSEAGERTIELCRRMNIPYISSAPDKPALTLDELREFFENSGVHMYAQKGEVVYVGNGFVGLHSLTGGRKSLILPRAIPLVAVYGADNVVQSGASVEFDIDECGTALFDLA